MGALNTAQKTTQYRKSLDEVLVTILEITNTNDDVVFPGKYMLKYAESCYVHWRGYRLL